MSSKPSPQRHDVQLPDALGHARLRHDPRGGRSDEFRLGERLRGDRGGGPVGDGLPSVPHTPDETEVSLRDDESAFAYSSELIYIGAEYDTEVAILEVEERFDEPALAALDSEDDLWAEAIRELAIRSMRR